MKKLNLKTFMAAFLICINLGTLLIVSPLSQNLSDLGNILGHKLYLLLWAISASLYLFVYTRLLMRYSKYKNKIGIIILYISCIGMVLSVILPYAPYRYPDLSKWHTRIAMYATISYILVFYHFLFDLMYKEYLSYIKFMRLFTTLVIFDLLLFLLNGGVSTLLEISFTIGMVILLPYMMKILKNE